MHGSNVPLPPFPARVPQDGPGVGVQSHAPLLHPLSGVGVGVGEVSTVQSFMTITDNQRFGLLLRLNRAQIAQLQNERVLRMEISSMHKKENPDKPQH